MAKAEVIGFEDLEKTLLRMADAEKIAVQAVDASTPIVEQALRGAIASSVNGHALAASITPTRARKNRYGVFSVIRPVGVDKRGRRFGEIMAYVEYGVPSRGIPAKHVRAQAKHQSEQQVHDIMERTLTEAFTK